MEWTDWREGEFHEGDFIELADGDSFRSCHFYNCTFPNRQSRVRFHECTFESETFEINEDYLHTFAGDGSEFVGSLFLGVKVYDFPASDGWVPVDPDA